MKEYKIVEIMGDFSTLVNTSINSATMEEAKDMVIQKVKNEIDKYLYAVVCEMEDK